MTPQQERNILEYARLALKNDREPSQILRERMKRIREELCIEEHVVLRTAQQLLTERRQPAH